VSTNDHKITASISSDEEVYEEFFECDDIDGAENPPSGGSQPHSGASSSEQKAGDSPVNKSDSSSSPKEGSSEGFIILL